MRFAALTILLASASCVATAGPRFPDDVAAALVDHGMRRLETDTLVIYYPAARRELAVRAAEKIARCQAAVEAKVTTHGWTTTIKPVIVMPELALNNAFVMPRTMGFEDVAVISTEETLDFATAFGLPPDPGAIGCHEIVHYVQAQQITGVWGVVDRIFGDVLSPQVGLDAWFWEGLAVYHEGQLQPGMGRLAWPAWRGVFAAAYAGGDLDGSDLSEAKRLAPPGHHYLVGSHFIEWLATTYGDDQLWQVIGRQAGTIVPQLDLNGRFKGVYGVSLSGLIDKFAAHLARDLPRRPVPVGQRVIRAVGSDARYARAPDGTEAIVAEDLDVPTHLEVRAPDGRVVFDDNLVDVIPPRQLVMAAPLLVSGMSFTADAKRLYLTVIDQGSTSQTPRLLRLDVPSGELDEIVAGVGPGGAVAPDGSVYWTLAADGDAWGLAELDLATHARRTVIAPVPGTYLLRAAPSPRGDKLALSRWDGTQFSIQIVDRAGAEQATIALGPEFPVYDASFVDDDRVIFLADVNGRFQVMMQELATGARVQITDAPYTAFEPRAAGGTVRFLDRESWRWDLDEVAIPAAAIPVTMRTDAATPADPYPAAAPLQIQSDRGYSIFDGLFVPRLHALAFASPASGALLFGAGLAGGDRLGLQRWAVTGYVNPTPKPARFSWAFGYHNAMLAPWGLSVQAQELRWHHPFDVDPDTTGYEAYADRRQLDVVGSLGRVVRGTTALSLEGLYTRDRFDESIEAGAPRVFRRLGGVGLTLAQDSTEATLYGGPRRRLAGALAGVYYPERTSTLSELIDARAELAITVPLPFTRRHRIDLDLIGRAAEPRGDAMTPPLLQIGGTGAISPLYQHTSPEVDPPIIDDDLLPEHVRFVEPLRGFEDVTMTAQRAALGTLRWRYPLIADYGWATSLYYFPAILIRELDLELFGTGALLDDGTGELTRHLAGGAAVTLSVYFWRVPLLVQYQASRRLTDDEAISQLVGIGVGL